MKLNRFFITIIVVCSCCAIKAQDIYQKTFPGERNGANVLTTNTSDGNVAAIFVSDTGQGPPMNSIERIDQFGNTISKSRIGPSSSAAYFSELNGVIATEDNGIVMFGKRSLIGYQQKATAIKVDSNDKVQWTVGFIYNTFQTTFTHGIHTNDGGFLFIANTHLLSFNKFETYLIKLDKNGSLEWKSGINTQPAYLKFEPGGVAESRRGGYYLVGSIYGSPHGTRLVKFSSQGVEQWIKEYAVSYSISGQMKFMNAFTTKEGNLRMFFSQRNYDSTSTVILETDSLGDSEHLYSYRSSDKLKFYEQTVFPAHDGGYLVGLKLYSDTATRGYVGFFKLGPDLLPKIGVLTKTNQKYPIAPSITQTIDNGYLIVTTNQFAPSSLHVPYLIKYGIGANNLCEGQITSFLRKDTSVNKTNPPSVQRVFNGQITNDSYSSQGAWLTDSTYCRGFVISTPEVVLADSQLEIFPNPSRGYFIIKAPLKKINDPIFVYDQYGKVHVKREWTREEVEISTISWPEGLYLVKSGAYLKKILVLK